MIKQLLNLVIAKYCDLSVSRRSLLATDKSRYFAQPHPIIVNYLYSRYTIYSMKEKRLSMILQTIYPISQLSNPKNRHQIMIYSSYNVIFSFLQFLMRVKEGIRISSKAIKQRRNITEKQFHQDQLALYRVLIFSTKDGMSKGELSIIIN